LKDLDLTINI